jgi:hypothetical protein
MRVTKTNSDLVFDPKKQSIMRDVTGASYFSKIDVINPVDNTVSPIGGPDVIFGGSGFPITAGQTLYIGTVVDSVEASVRMPMPQVTMTELYVASAVSPGGGQTFTYTVMKNGVATALTAQISGSGTEASDTNPAHSVTFSATDKFSLRVVTSGGSATAYHTYSVKIE